MSNTFYRVSFTNRDTNTHSNLCPSDRKRRTYHISFVNSWIVLICLGVCGVGERNSIHSNHVIALELSLQVLYKTLLKPSNQICPGGVSHSDLQIITDNNTSSLYKCTSKTHRQMGGGRRPLRYLVVPHADIRPNVIVDYGLLFIFRLQKHTKKKTMTTIFR